MSVSVERLSHFDALDDSVRRAWDTLPRPSPMQSRAWLQTWFAVFGPGLSALPCVVVVRREGDVIGLAPWYIATSRLGVRTLRFLGDGLICSDHASLLTRPDDMPIVVAALAAWLQRTAGHLWDVVQFESVDASAVGVRELIAQLSGVSCCTLERPRPACWTVDLPATVDEYHAQLSKNHRKRCRRWWKEYFATARARVHEWRGEQLDAGLQELQRLNLARREVVGDRSAFVDARFQEFHRRVVPLSAAEGSVSLRSLVVDGRPCAVEYLLQQGTTLYCYQSGMEPTAARDGTGNLSLLAMFVGAIEAGFRRIDFLRGDEDYKRHWNARPEPCGDLYLASTSLAGRADALRVRTLAWARSLRGSQAAPPVELALN